MGLSEELRERIDGGGAALSMPMCELGDDGAAQLAAALGLRDPANPLTSLVLASNGIGESSVTALVESLGLWQLKKFDLSFNGAADAGAGALSKLLADSSSLEYLDLEANGIGDPGVCAIASALATNATLTHLDLSGNYVGLLGATKLGEALRENETLESLHLSSTGLGPEGAASLADALMDNRSLSSLHLQHCTIGDTGAQAFATAMPAYTNLRCFNLSDNSIGPDGIVPLLNAALAARGACGAHGVFHLDQNHLGDEGVAALVPYFRAGRHALHLGDMGISAVGLAMMAEAVESGENAFWYIMLDGNADIVGSGSWCSNFSSGGDKPEVQAAERIQRAVQAGKAKRVHVPALIRTFTANTQDFYRELLQGRTRGLRRCKVALVGSGYAGKTTLLKRMTRQKFEAETESTRGISECQVDITTWRPGSVDQGGMSDYHQAVAAVLEGKFRQHQTEAFEDFEQRKDAMLEELFAFFDVDHDGYLNKEQVRHLLKSMNQFDLGYQTDEGWTDENWKHWVRSLSGNSALSDEEAVRGIDIDRFKTGLTDPTSALAVNSGVSSIQDLYDAAVGNFVFGGRAFKLGQGVRLRSDRSSQIQLSDKVRSKLQQEVGQIVCINNQHHMARVGFEDMSEAWVDMLALDTISEDQALEKLEPGLASEVKTVNVTIDQETHVNATTPGRESQAVGQPSSKGQSEVRQRTQARSEGAIMQRHRTMLNSEGVFREDEFPEVHRMVSDRVQAAITGEGEDIPTITCMDFAGQKMYEHMHHIFIQDKLSIYIAVFSLEAALDATLQDEDSDHNVTQLQNLLFWLNTIHAQAPSSPIMVVGTHADCVTSEQRQMTVQKLELCFEGASFERQLVCSDAGEQIICVDNTSPIDEGLAEVRRLVEVESKELPGYGDTVPLSWLRFLDRALELAKEEQRSFISLDEAGQLAEANEIDAGRELMLLLQLFTDLGLLMHFDMPALRNMVVLNTQWLLDVMCELLCLRSIGEKMKRSRSKGPEWRRLRRNGRLDARLLPDIWPKLDEDQRAIMLEYMIKFGLVCALPKQEHDTQTYAVPALLPPCTDPASVWPDDSESDTQASLFFIHADGDWDESPGFLPQSLFFSLVAALLQEMDAVAVKEVLQHLYRDRICIFSSQLFMMVLKPDKHRIELTVRADEPSDPATVAARIDSILSGCICKKYGVKHRLDVPCAKCGSLTDVVRPRCSKCKAKIDSKAWILDKPLAAKSPGSKLQRTSTEGHGETLAAGAARSAATSGNRAKIFASMRFKDGAVLPEAKQLQSTLAPHNAEMQIIDMGAGGDIDTSVFAGIEECETFLVFGTSGYGEDTGNSASTFYEYKHARSQRKRIILIRMIPFDQEFEHLQGRVIFGANKLCLFWMQGEPMPPTLVGDILKAIAVPRSSVTEPEPEPDRSAAGHSDVAVGGHQTTLESSAEGEAGETKQSPVAGRAQTPPRAVTPPARSAWQRMCLCLAPAVGPIADGRSEV